MHFVWSNGSVSNNNRNRHFFVISSSNTAIDFTDQIELPSEIWSEIFSYLPLRDRKQLCLTCHRFYELCNALYFLRKEILVIHRNLDPEINFLAITSRRICNVKLDHGVKVDHTILPFLERQGSNLRSVVINDCEFTAGAFKRLIECCDALDSVSIRFFCTLCDNKCMYKVLSDLKVLKSLSIVRHKVVCLTLNIPYLPSLDFFLLFDIFPSIKRLDLKIEMLGLLSQPNTILFPFSHLYDRILSIRDQLEILILKFGQCPWNYPPFLSEMLVKISKIQMKNLKQFSLNWLCYLPDTSDLNPFLTFQQLTHFDLNTRQIASKILSPTLIPNFLELLISRTNLRSLSVSGYSLLITRKLFEALVNSKLTYLYINMNLPSSGVSIDFLSSSLENTLTPNYNVRFLDIGEACGSVKCIFYTYFRNVKHLNFPEVDDGVLSHVFQLQREIYRLNLENRESAPYRNCIFREFSFYQQWLKTEETSIKRELEYLTYLEMKEDKFSLTNFILSEFIFPKLKVLDIYIHVETEFDLDKCVRLLQNIPLLEDLMLDLPISMSYPKWLALFNSLTKLRNFHMKNGEGNFFNESEYLELFNVRPSLRSVTHYKRNGFTRSVTYTKDGREMR